jgi:hypothetical protein
LLTATVALRAAALPGNAETRASWPASVSQYEGFSRSARRHYEDDLVSLGLLRDLEGVAKSGRRRKVAIADLGRLLLDAINKNEEQ